MKFKDITTKNFAGKSPIERDTFNIMGSVLGGVAGLIEEVSEYLADSYRGRYSAFLSASSNIETLIVLIRSYYIVSEKELKLLDLRLQIVEQCKKGNMVREGTEILSEIFSILLRILNRSGAIFPKARKSMSFGKFVEEETK